jgi:hypothetical protein
MSIVVKEVPMYEGDDFETLVNFIDDLINGSYSKSHKVRELYKLYVMSEYQISKALGLQPCFVNNVIRRFQSLQNS